MLLFAPIRWALKIVSLLLTGVVVYFAITLVQIWLTGREHSTLSAQAIVVMGAAEYNGVPSPDLRARLDEAYALFERRRAALIVVTGSKQRGDRFTEAQASARYLESRGVSSSDILRVEGNDSWANLVDVAAILEPRGDRHVLIVTDPFHEDRSMAIASAVGLIPLPDATTGSPIKGFASIPYYLKEMVGVGLGRIVGFKYLHLLG